MERAEVYPSDLRDEAGAAEFDEKNAVPEPVALRGETLPGTTLPGSRLHWTELQRVGFRMAFLFFFCFMFLDGNGTIFGIFPKVGDWVYIGFTWPLNHLAQWLGQHLFHLTGVAAKLHGTGSGDTAMNWIEAGEFVVLSVVGGLVWSGIAKASGSRRTEYQTLYAWLRFGLRLTCGMFMMNYGLAKLYPMQMAPISIAVLNEPLGQSSPMTLLWSLLGMNPAYEMICGAAEVAGGVLFLFRRTALMGALLSAFVMTNVVLYNFFFDVPVKLFAMYLLLACLFVALPDVPALYRFFWKHEPAAPAGVWVPPMSRKGFRIATRVVELVFVAGFLIWMPIQDGMNWHRRSVAEHTASPLLGAWTLDASHPATGAFIDPEGRPVTNLYLDSAGRAFSRAGNGELWRTGIRLNDKEKTIGINCYTGTPVTYAWQMPDPNHVVLTPVPPKPDAKAKPPKKPAAPFTAQVVTLTRIPLPDHYPLLERGFHLVNEWGLER